MCKCIQYVYVRVYAYVYVYIPRLWIYVFCLVGQRCQRCQKATGAFPWFCTVVDRKASFPDQKASFPDHGFIHSTLERGFFFGILSCVCHWISIVPSNRQTFVPFWKTAANMITLEDSRYKPISTSVGKLTLLGSQQIPQHPQPAGPRWSIPL